MLTKSVAVALMACVVTSAEAPTSRVLPDVSVPKLVARAAVPLPRPLLDFSLASPKKYCTPRTSSSCGPSIGFGESSMNGSINSLPVAASFVLTCSRPKLWPISCISVSRKYT